MRDDPMVSSLLAEVLQAERSGIEHGNKEAERLGDVEPGRAMYALAQDCRRARDRLAAIVGAKQARAKSLGEIAGATLSMLRDRIADLVVTKEKSYRGTLLGVHHGIDAIELLDAAAERVDDIEIVEWCRETIERRAQLLVTAHAALDWFAEHPVVAQEPTKATLVGKGLRALGRVGAAGVQRR